MQTSNDYLWEMLVHADKASMAACQNLARLNVLPTPIDGVHEAERRTHGREH